MPLLATFAGASARGLGFQAGAAEIPGLQLISTESFTDVASYDVDGVFSNDYVQYKIVLDVEPLTVNGLNFRFRASGVTNSNTDYNRQTFIGNNTTVSRSRSTSASSWETLVYDEVGCVLFEILNPFQTQYTSAIASSVSDASTIQLWNLAFGMDVTTSYDGFHLFMASGNMTGAVSVYGYYKG